MTTINWEGIPAEYNWYAVDGNGVGYAYTGRPKLINNQWCSHERTFHVGWIECDEWQSSLQQRPSKQPSEANNWTKVVRALEMIAVGDVDKPKEFAESVLIEIGVWLTKTQEEQDAITLLESMGYCVEKV